MNSKNETKNKKKRNRLKGLKIEKDFEKPDEEVLEFMKRDDVEQDFDMIFNLNRKNKISNFGYDEPTSIRQNLSFSKVLCFLSCIIMAFLFVVSVFNSYTTDANFLVGFKSATANFICMTVVVGVLYYFIVLFLSKLFLKYLYSKGAPVSPFVNDVLSVVLFWVSIRIIMVSASEFLCLIVPAISNFYLLFNILFTIFAGCMIFIDLKRNLASAITFPFLFKRIFNVVIWACVIIMFFTLGRWAI